MILRVIVFLLLFSCSGGVHSQVLGNEAYKNRSFLFLDELYNLNFTQAQQIADQMVREYPKEPASWFMNALGYWWRIALNDQTTTYDDAFYASIDSCLKYCDRLEKIETAREEYLFFTFMSYAFRARLHANREDWFKSVNAARKCLPYLFDGKKLENPKDEFLFGIGLYDYYAEYYPEENPAVKPLIALFPSGNTQKGIEELRQTSNSRNFAQTEAMYFLMRIYAEEQNKPSLALMYAERLQERYPENTLFLSWKIRILYKLNRFKDCETLVDQMLKEFNKLDQPFEKRQGINKSNYTTQVMTEACFYKAQLERVYKSNLPSAIQQYKNTQKLLALNGITEHPYLPESEFFIGLCLEKQGLRTQAVPYYSKAVKMKENDAIKNRASGCLDKPCL